MSEITMFIKRNDINLFYLLNKKIHCRTLNGVMKLFTEFGSTAFAVVLAVIFLLFHSILPDGLGAVLVLNLIGSQIIIQLLKRIVNRQRPYKTHGWVLSIKPPKCQYSFPSGHTSSAFSIALVVASFIPGLKFIIIPVAIMVGMSRVYLGCHYPTDVFIGFFISCTVFLIVAQIFTSQLI